MSTRPLPYALGSKELATASSPKTCPLRTSKAPSDLNQMTILPVLSMQPHFPPTNTLASPSEKSLAEPSLGRSFAPVLSVP